MRRFGTYSSRQKMIWKNVKGIPALTAVGVATALGAGLSPVAPGTMGTLVGLPVAYLTRHWPWEARLAFWGALTLLGTWAAKVFDHLMGTSDNQCIVIDEVIGIGITAWTLGDDLRTWLLAFVLFRFFDVLKPPPVRQVDRWSKNKSEWAGGFGVIADDMVAGVQGLGIIFFLQWLAVLPS